MNTFRNFLPHRYTYNDKDFISINENIKPNIYFFMGRGYRLKKAELKNTLFNFEKHMRELNDFISSNKSTNYGKCQKSYNSLKQSLK